MTAHSVFTVWPSCSPLSASDHVSRTAIAQRHVGACRPGRKCQNKMIGINIIRRGGLLVAGLSAAALILAACSSAGGSGGSGGAPLTPRHALLAAATQARHMTSATEILTTRISGIQSETLTGTVLVQLKPTLQLDANLSLAAAGKSTKIREILTGTDLYLSTASLTTQFGKPWVKVDLSTLKGTAAAGLAQLVHSLQNSNFSSQAETLSLAKNARVVGTRTVDGVSTTEYACSVKAAEALKALPASFRKSLAPELRALGNATLSFRVWIDGQNQMRKVIEVVTVNGETVHTTVTVTAINQPVHITLPPASQTATRP